MYKIYCIDKEEYFVFKRHINTMCIFAYLIQYFYQTFKSYRALGYPDKLLNNYQCAILVTKYISHDLLREIINLC